MRRLVSSVDVPSTASLPTARAAARRPKHREPRGASAALAKARIVERELGRLAVELETGRDAALLRAISFFRRFVREGRRAGRAPDEFLRELLATHARRDIHHELAELRRKVEVLAGEESRPAGPRAGRPRDPSALEILLMAKGRLKVPDGARGVAAEMAGSESGTGADAPERHGAILDGSRLAQHPLRIAVGAAPALASPAPAAPAAKSDYADRRIRLPKITF